MKECCRIPARVGSRPLQGNNPPRMAPKTRTAKSLATTTHIVLPNDTNVLGNLMGGQLWWMDIASPSAPTATAGVWS